MNSTSIDIEAPVLISSTAEKRHGNLIETQVWRHRNDILSRADQDGQCTHGSCTDVWGSYLLSWSLIDDCLSVLAYCDVSKGTLTNLKTTNVCTITLPWIVKVFWEQLPAPVRSALLQQPNGLKLPGTEGL